MGKYFYLEVKIKNKIKQLIDEKKIKITKLSADMGYHPTFLNSILGKEGKFFNLEQVGRFCTALNYPVSQLFADVEREPKSLTPAKIDRHTYNLFVEMERESGGFFLELNELYDNVKKLTPEKQKILMSLLVKTMEAFAGFAREEGSEKKVG